MPVCFTPPGWSETSTICLDVNGGKMIYKVKARVIDETIGEYYRKLADGTVAKQRPDGEEIVASMKRAVLTGPGVAEWYEMCSVRRRHWAASFSSVCRST